MVANIDPGRDASAQMACLTQPDGSARSYIAVLIAIREHRFPPTHLREAFGQQTIPHAEIGSGKS
jgi:hypothetical protein